MSASLSGKGLRLSGLTLWVLVAFIGAQVVAGLLVVAVAKVWPDVAGLNSAVLALVTAALSYVIAFVGILVVDKVRHAHHTPWNVLGLGRSMSWSDIGIGLLSLLPYYVMSGVLVLLLAGVFSFIDVNQAQNIPYQNLVLRYEYIIAFIALVVLAPVVEELIFRGYFLGKMTQSVKPWLAVVVTSLVFGLLHLPGEVTASGVTLQWAVMLDTFALGLVLGALRIWTGSVWASILLHMLKNALAYFFLFVYPNLAGTM